MSDADQSELLRRFCGLLAHCRDTLEFWEDSDLRLIVGGMDITDAELAALRERAAHLQRLTEMMQAEQRVGQT